MKRHRKIVATGGLPVATMNVLKKSPPPATNPKVQMMAKSIEKQVWIPQFTSRASAVSNSLSK
jgi:hypothetical protein